MYRLSVILRHTFVEAVTQPIYPLVLLIGAAILGIFTFLPFFTLGDDTRMFKSVSIDVILLLVLIVTLLATSKSIYEEIEDRTMLTLMSKPVARWEVLVGKYLGLIAAAGLAVIVLGIVLLAGVYQRVPGDYLISTRSLYAAEAARAWDYRRMHMSGVYPSLALIWMQVSVLAAISVAISTRLSLVVNLPLVIIVYLAGNLTRFIPSLLDDPKRGILTKTVGWIGETIFPFLSVFDLRHLTVFKTIRLPGSVFAMDDDGIFASQMWIGTGAAAGYAVLYVTAALSLGLLLFRSRELGGAEG
jgi:ABC-type transport system involved in multi-copper enzyme maturation permease subunit